MTEEELRAECERPLIAWQAESRYQYIAIPERGERPPPGGVLTPQILRNAVVKILRDMIGDGLGTWDHRPDDARAFVGDHDHVCFIDPLQGRAVVDVPRVARWLVTGP